MALEILGEILRLTVFAGLALAGLLVIFIWKKDLTRKVSYLRIFIQAASIVAFFYLFTYPLWLLLMLTIILIMTLFLGRFLCGWFCPFGFYMDLITELRKALRIRYRNLPEKINKILHELRYVLLVFFLILPFVLGPMDSLLLPFALFFIGPFKPLRILLGPIVPLILPWKELIVVNEINISYPYLQEFVEYFTGISVSIYAFVFIALTVTGAFIFRRFWCRFCPTGASIAIVNRFRGFKWAPILHLDKDEEKCTKCGICKRVCPVQVTEVYEQKGGKIMTSMCMLCLRCVEMCPYEECLKVKAGRKTIFKSRNWLEPSTTE